MKNKINLNFNYFLNIVINDSSCTSLSIYNKLIYFLSWWNYRTIKILNFKIFFSKFQLYSFTVFLFKYLNNKNNKINRINYVEIESNFLIYYNFYLYKFLT